MKNKNSLNKLKRSYFKVPNKLHEVNLSVTAIAMYSYMAKMPEDFYPSVGVMAKSLNISKNTVLKYLGELKNRNIIRMIQQGGENVITKYEFTKPDDWL